MPGSGNELVSLKMPSGLSGEKRLLSFGEIIGMKRMQFCETVGDQNENNGHRSRH